MSEGFLRPMVEATRAAIAEPGYLRGLPEPPPPRPERLRSALLAAPARSAILAEYKRRSPGARESVLPFRTIEAFTAATAPAAVAGYSCLASVPHFRGGPADVLELARRVRQPVLFKDFVVDPVQVEAAARAGARAVLLIARLETEGLLTTTLASLAGAAHSRGLDVLLEWHDRAELRQTEGVPADVYGVNVRDLDSLALRWPVAEETLRAADAFRPLVGMSGVGGPAEADRFWNAGADAVLVGSALARADDPARFLAQLRRPSPEVRP